MAGELFGYLNKRTQTGANVEVQLLDAKTGLLVGGAIATINDPVEAIARGDMPGGTPAGCYVMRFQRVGNKQVLSQGNVCWDGTNVVTESELAYIQLQSARFDAIDNAITASQTAILGEINDGVTITAADKATLVTLIDAALINSADGFDLAGAIASSVEQAILNETDGNLTLAGIGGVLAAQLATYDAATATDVTAAQAAIITALPPAPTATGAQQTAILNAIGALVAGLNPAQQLQLTDIQNLLRADEIRDDTTNPKTVEKLIAGTSTVLLTKEVEIFEDANGCPERIEVTQP